MAINRASISKELLPGLNAVFGMEYGEVNNEHEPLFEIENSDRAFEEEVLFTGFGTAPTKGEGASVSYDDAQESYSARYTAETIALAFAVTEEAMEDNLYDALSARYTKALARAMAYTKQVKAASLLNNGFTTFQSGDGVTLFSTAHPTVQGGNNGNRPAVNADLNETSLEDAVINIAAFVDERGLLIAARPQKLIVPPALMFVATRLLQTDLRVGTADNDINALRSNGSIAQGYRVNHYLTDNDAFFLTTDVPNGMKHFVRTAMSTSMDGDFDTGNVRYKARERYSFGVSDPLGVYGSPGA